MINLLTLFFKTTLFYPGIVRLRIEKNDVIEIKDFKKK